MNVYTPRLLPNAAINSLECALNIPAVGSDDAPVGWLVVAMVTGSVATVMGSVATVSLCPPVGLDSVRSVLCGVLHRSAVQHTWPGLVPQVAKYCASIQKCLAMILGGPPGLWW